MPVQDQPFTEALGSDEMTVHSLARCRTILAKLGFVTGSISDMILLSLFMRIAPIFSLS